MISDIREGEEETAGDVFAAGQETVAEEPFKYDEESINLVTEFKKHREGRLALRRIATKCLQDFEDAWAANDQVRTNNAKHWKLFAGTLDDKDGIFKETSNLHIPIMMENVVRMVSRQAYELFGNWTQVFGVQPIGPDDENTARLLSAHGNWQIRRRIKDFKRQIGHRGLLIFNLFGDVTCHSYYDQQNKTNRHEVLTASEFVCANAHVSTMPDYSDVSWLAKVIHMDGHELRKMRGKWEGVTEALQRMPPEWDDAVISQELREVVDQATGVDSTAFQKGQYRIIQYEGWMNLPAPTGGEERDRYIQAFIDFQTQSILKLVVYERIDPFDKQRFEFEQKQLQAWQQSRQEVQMFMAEQEQTRMSALALAHSQNPSGDGVSQGIAMARAVEEMPAPQEMPMPPWMKGDENAQPEPPQSVPIRLFAHGVNIEPIEGVIGLGFGAILGPQNRAANISAQMFVDQAQLGNLKNFLAKPNARLPERLPIGPGKIHQIQGSVDLQKDFVPLDFGPANPQLLELVSLLQRNANAVSNTPEVLAGEAGKSGETAQGLANRIEQATKMLSVPTGKYADFVTQVLINNATLNAVYLPDVEFFMINNHDPALGKLGNQGFSVAREMYDREYIVEISADLKFTSTSQRISEADALVQMPNAVAALQTNFALQFETIKKSFEARGRYDLIDLMGQPPEPPQMFGIPTSPPAPPPGMTPPGAPGAPPDGSAPQPPQQGAPPQ